MSTGEKKKKKKNPKRSIGLPRNPEITMRIPLLPQPCHRRAAHLAFEVGTLHLKLLLRSFTKR